MSEKRELRRFLIDCVLMALLGAAVTVIAHVLHQPNPALIVGIAGGGGWAIGSRQRGQLALYHWPSWCQQHRRPHIQVHPHCATNRERRDVARLITERLGRG